MAQDAAVRPAFIVPPHVPGEKMAEFARRTSVWIKSSEVGVGDTDVVNIFELPGNALITGGLVHVKTAFDASGTSAAATATITVPYDTGPVVIYDANLTGLQATGFQPTTGFVLTPASGGFAIVNYTAGSGAVGGFEVFLSYVQLADRL